MNYLIIVCSLISITLRAQVYTGVATYFDGLGTPYGGCGVPENILESPYFVALNVFNTPGVSTDYTRPIPPANAAVMGEFQNGMNCGRWVKVRIGPNCIGGINDGAIGQAFCRNGGVWTDDAFSGAELYMLVTDACGDGNGWCRDSPYHLDLSRASLNNFQKDGSTVNTMFPLNWNNRQISWEYVTAPNYSGDIKIWFLQAAQTYWPAIMINHLENGIHRVEQKIGNTWVTAQRNSDMGQAFILQGSGPYLIRVYDSDDELINGGREYLFTLPPSCHPSCSPAVTPVTYTTNDPLPIQIIQFNAEAKRVVALVQSNRLLYGYRFQGSQNGIDWQMLEFFPSTNEYTQYLQLEIETAFKYYKIECLNERKSVSAEKMIAATSDNFAGKIVQESAGILRINDEELRQENLEIVDVQGRQIPFEWQPDAEGARIVIHYRGLVFANYFRQEEMSCQKFILQYPEY